MVTCVMCYTGLELHCAQGVLIYLLVRMSSAHGSQMKFKAMCTPLSGVVHTGCTLCQVFLLLDCMLSNIEVRKMTKIRKQYNHAPHLTQDTTWESKKTTINITNKSQEVSPFSAGDHKAAISRRERMRNTRHKKHK